MSSERPISVEHEARLKTALRLQADQALPDHICDLYDDVRRAARALGMPVSDHELILTVMLAHGAPPPPPQSFLDDSSELNTGARVIAKFRNSWRWGQYIRTDWHEKKVVVALDDDGVERKFQPANVRFPTADELRGIGEL